MDAKILIVEDEAALVTTLRDRLRKEGYAVSTARNGVSGFDLASSKAFDLLILDLMLPGQDGLTVCQKVRQRGLRVPILMLTARRQLKDKIAGLEIGADDYLTKPFQMAELLARVEALLRRARRTTAGADAAAAVYQFETVSVDVMRTEVSRGSKTVVLSAKEFQLLKYFLEHRGATLSRDVLLREVWGYACAPAPRTVDVHVAWLRQKLENDPKNPDFILTVVGFGYRFAD
jgi:two-component system, OmpR family, alkaline phosphatase synthesis response regulator PhoP